MVVLHHPPHRVRKAFQPTRKNPAVANWLKRTIFDSWVDRMIFDPRNPSSKFGERGRSRNFGTVASAHLAPHRLGGHGCSSLGPFPTAAFDGLSNKGRVLSHEPPLSPLFARLKRTRTNGHHRVFLGFMDAVNESDDTAEAGNSAGLQVRRVPRRADTTSA